MLTRVATIIIAVTAVLVPLSIIAVALRFYARHLQRVRLGIDDYLILVALFLSTAANILTSYASATTGVGDPSYVPTEEAIVTALKFDFAIENSLIASIGICKVSMLLFYRRIFIMNWFLRANTVLIVLVSCFTLSILLSIIFSKWPVYEQWNPEAPFKLNSVAILISFVSVNALFDLIILGLPLFAVTRLQMSKERKLFLSTLFTTGSICVVASLFRLYYAVRYTEVTETSLSLFEPPFIFNVLWANIETPAFIITGSLLSFGPFFQYKPGKLSKYLSSILSLSSRRGKRSSSVETLDISNKSASNPIAVKRPQRRYSRTSGSQGAIRN